MKQRERIITPRITPFLWFDGQAEAAAKFYTAIFENSKILDSSPMCVTFELAGQRFMALNGGPHYKLTEAISFFVRCDTQKEIDYYWRKLSSKGTSLQCGWLTDKFGVTWQIIPSILGELLGDPDQTKSQRAMDAMLKMVKLDIRRLKNAFAGRR